MREDMLKDLELDMLSIQRWKKYAMQGYKLDVSLAIICEKQHVSKYCVYFYEQL